MKKRSLPASNIGSATLLMTFIVLCLVTFAVLSLSGAVREHNYTRQLSLHNSEYYEASNAAVEIVRSIDKQLAAAHAQQSSAPAGRDAYFSAAETALSEISGITADFSADLPTVTFEVPVNDTQALRVVLELNPPQNFADGYYTIKTWQEISTIEWHGDDTLNLM